MRLERYLSYFPPENSTNNIIRQTIRYAAKLSLEELRQYIEKGSLRPQHGGIAEALATLREMYIDRRQEENE